MLRIIQCNNNKITFDNNQIFTNLKKVLVKVNLRSIAKNHGKTVKELISENVKLYS